MTLIEGKRKQIERKRKQTQRKQIEGTIESIESIQYSVSLNCLNEMFKNQIRTSHGLREFCRRNPALRDQIRKSTAILFEMLDPLQLLRVEESFPFPVVKTSENDRKTIVVVMVVRDRESWGRPRRKAVAGSSPSWPSGRWNEAVSKRRPPATLRSHLCLYRPS